MPTLFRIFGFLPKFEFVTKFLFITVFDLSLCKKATCFE